MVTSTPTLTKTSDGAQLINLGLLGVFITCHSTKFRLTIRVRGFDDTNLFYSLIEKLWVQILARFFEAS
jgi:hypothetical protein